MSLYRRSQALILKREVIGESDRRYTVLTPLYGRLDLKARGAQKITSKLAGTLEPPALVQLAFVAGRQVHTLIAADTVNPYRAIRTRADRLSQASFINETLVALIGEGQGEGDLAVWDLALAVYHELDQQRMVSPVLGAYFVIRLLTMLGLAPRFDREARGNRLRARTHQFSLYQGGLVTAKSADDDLMVSADAVKVLRLLQQGDLTTTRRVKAPEPVVREVSRVAARLLAFHRPEAAPALTVLQALVAPA